MTNATSAATLLRRWEPLGMCGKCLPRRSRWELQELITDRREQVEDGNRHLWLHDSWMLQL